MKQHFGDKVYNVVIPRNVRLPRRRATVCRRWCTILQGAQAYLALAQEMLEKQPAAVA